MANEDLHPNDYLPFVLVNDIIRYWRIVLLSHESRLRKKKNEINQNSNISTESKEALLLAELSRPDQCWQEVAD